MGKVITHMEPLELVRVTGPLKSEQLMPSPWLGQYFDAFPNAHFAEILFSSINILK